MPPSDAAIPFSKRCRAEHADVPFLGVCDRSSAYAPSHSRDSQGAQPGSTSAAEDVVWLAARRVYVRAIVLDMPIVPRVHARRRDPDQRGWVGPLDRLGRTRGHPVEMAVACGAGAGPLWRLPGSSGSQAMPQTSGQVTLGGLGQRATGIGSWPMNSRVATRCGARPPRV
jgi:hypothetical protein